MSLFIFSSFEGELKDAVAAAAAAGIEADSVWAFNLAAVAAAAAALTTST